MSNSSMYPHGSGDTSPEILAQPRQGVGAVMIKNRNNQILVSYSLKRRVWDIPQGKSEGSEGHLETVLREVKEEINLNLDTSRLDYRATFKSPDKGFGNKPFITNLYFYEVSPEEEAQIKNMELNKLKDLHWVNPQQIPQPYGLSLRIALVLDNIR